MTELAVKYDDEFKPVWKNRRLVIFLSLLFSAAVIVYVMVWGEDTRVNETIIQFAFIFGGAIIGAYVFNATWEDVTKLRK